MDIAWKHLSKEDARAYDRFVEGSETGHYAQTRAWTRVANAGTPYGVSLFLAKESSRIVGAAVVLRLQVGPLPLPVALVERGPVAALEDFDRVLNALCEQCKRRGIVRLSVMPYASRDTGLEERLIKLGFRLDQSVDGTHASTLRMPIAKQTDDELFSGSARKKLRYEINHAERSGVVVRLAAASKDVRILHDLDSKLMATQNRWAKGARWFDAVWRYINEKANGALFIAEHEGAPLAAVLIFKHAGRATYVAGASIAEQRPFSKVALPLSRAIRWAGAQGCTEFDFGGIPMEGDTDEKRARIAQFKLDFTKDRVELVRRHMCWLWTSRRNGVRC